MPHAIVAMRKNTIKNIKLIQSAGIARDSISHAVMKKLIQEQTDNTWAVKGDLAMMLPLVALAGLSNIIQKVFGSRRQRV